MSEEVNGSIRYTAKELFEKIDGKLDVIDGKLDDKIGRAEFEELKTRVNLLEAKVWRYSGAIAVAAAGATLAANHYFG